MLGLLRRLESQRGLPRRPFPSDAFRVAVPGAVKTEVGSEVDVAHADEQVFADRANGADHAASERFQLDMVHLHPGEKGALEARAHGARETVKGVAFWHGGRGQGSSLRAMWIPSRIVASTFSTRGSCWIVSLSAWIARPASS